MHIPAGKTHPCIRIFPETTDLIVDEFMHNSPPAVVLHIWPPRQILATRPLVADHIAKDPHPLNGGPTEEKTLMVQSLMHHPAENLVGRFSLLQFAGLLKRCAAIITLDSFRMHLAAALGIPTIALFGANKHIRANPRIVVEPPPEIPRNAQAKMDPDHTRY